MKINGYFRLTSLIAIMLATIGTGLFFYNDYLQDNLSAQMCSTLDEIMRQQAHNFTSKLRGDQKIMQGFAELVAEISLDKESLKNIMGELVRTTDFDYMSFATPDGAAFNDKGDSWSAADRDFFKKALAGETVISEPLKSRVRDDTIIVVSTPVRKSGEIVGVLFGSYKSEELDKLFLASFEDKGYAYIANNAGEIIANTMNSYSLLGSAENLFEFWKNADFYMHDDLDTIRKNVLVDKGGHARYNFKGQNRYLHYSTIEVNSWNIFSVVPEQAIAGTSNRILAASAILTLVTALVFFIFVAYNYLEQKRHISELSKMAYFDKLTGAPNFNKFRIEASALIKRNPKTRYVVAKLDINRFKLINNTYGRTVGDEILRAVNRVLRKVLDPQTDAYCRLNSDMFVVLVERGENSLYEVKRQEFEALVNEETAAFIHEKLLLPEGRYYPGENETDIDEIFERANFAHRLAKDGGHPICDYDEKLRDLAVMEKEIENRMEHALAEREFKVFLQPKYRLSDETVSGAEALVRWKSDGVDISFPNIFIPIFEKNGFVTKLDMYIFENVCKFLRHLADSGIVPPVISVNFSRVHLGDSLFVSSLCDLADKYNVPRSLLEIELTESAMLDNAEILLAVLHRLHEEGFTLSMDDFGTGYSSLGLLKDIPIDTIKIDRSFFLSARDSNKAKSVLLNVIRMAKDLKIHTVAEGVEEKPQIDMLKEMGCDVVQGYYYAKPMPTDEFEILIKG